MSLLSSILPIANRGQTESGQAESRNENVREPVYRVSEKEDAYALSVQLPGVSREDLQVTAEDDVLVIRGERRWQAPSEWQTLHRESGDEVFQLRLRHDSKVDVDKIQAEHRDGVLNLTLPKVDAIKPRKITIK